MFVKPVAPPYDPIEWATKPFPEKSRMVCQAWAVQGYGSPLAVYVFYAVKILLYAAGWLFFCSFTPGLGRLADVAAWGAHPVAFQKAIVWSMLFEIAGLGCGSGPLTGRYVPPVGGALYFLRPGTTKLPLFPALPAIGGDRRSWFDVLLYAANAALALAVLLAAQPAGWMLVSIAVLLPVLGVLDKTLFLCARGEHYWTTLAVMCLSPASFVAGSKGVHAALWFWAGFSKLNHHFPSVVGVMTSNNPLARHPALRRLMYRKPLGDLSPSTLAVAMGHVGTALELAVPLLLVFGRGGTATTVGLVLMLALHGFITSNVPAGVPLEWNLMMVYGGLVLFGASAHVRLTEMEPAVACVVLVMCVLLPLAGNIAPSRVPFLLAMRYYAGNWAYSVWLFRGESYRRLDKLTKSAGWVYDQLGRLYTRSESVGIVGRAMAFRLMHLHGRLLAAVLPQAVDRVEDYEWLDGEIVAGLVLGWNFGDGHLHSEQLLRAVQAQCGFEEGELRCIMVEAQPLGRPTLQYRIVDAMTGLRARGEARIDELRKLQPWEAVPGRRTS